MTARPLLDAPGAGDLSGTPAPAIRCVGAFLRPCTNLTERILCDACYGFIDRTLNPTRRRAAAETRTVYRAHHGRHVQDA